VSGGRVVVVTGATAGLGLGVATAFARAGDTVIGCGRRVTHGREVEQRLRSDGLDFTFVAADASTAAGARGFVDEAATRCGSIDVLVNNAGTVGPDPSAELAQIDEAAFDQVVATYLKGPFFAAQAAAEVMAQKGRGTIFTVGSAAGELIGADLLPYRAAKAGLMFLSRCLAAALAPSGIVVHTLVLYRVDSDGGRRTTASRIERSGLGDAEARLLWDDYEVTAVRPEDVGAAFVQMVDRPSMLIGPGFVVRP